MPTLALEVSEEELAWFEAWIEAKGLTPEAGFSLLLHAVLRKNALEEPAQRPGVDPRVQAITGIIPDDGRDYKEYREDYINYLEQKHR